MKQKTDGVRLDVLCCEYEIFDPFYQEVNPEAVLKIICIHC